MQVTKMSKANKLHLISLNIHIRENSRAAIYLVKCDKGWSLGVEFNTILGLPHQQ